MLERIRTQLLIILEGGGKFLFFKNTTDRFHIILPFTKAEKLTNTSRLYTSRFHYLLNPPNILTNMNRTSQGRQNSRKRWVLGKGGILSKTFHKSGHSTHTRPPGHRNRKRAPNPEVWQETERKRSCPATTQKSGGAPDAMNACALSASANPDKVRRAFGRK